MSNPFKIGDKVRFVDNELNRAEMCEITLSRIFEVELVNNKDKSIEIGFNGESHDSACDTVWHYSRFEQVPQYAVGQYVKFSTPNGNGYGIIVGKIRNMCDIYELNQYKTHWELYEYYFAAVLPSEVIVDFGNGIKGKISTGAVDADGHVMTFFVTPQKGWCSLIVMSMLTDPMKTIVQDLLAAQEREGGK